MIPFPPQEKEDQQKKDISAVQFSQPQFAQQAGQPAGAFGAQQGRKHRLKSRGMFLRDFFIGTASWYVGIINGAHPLSIGGRPAGLPETARPVGWLGPAFSGAPPAGRAGARRSGRRPPGWTGGWPGTAPAGGRTSTAAGYPSGRCGCPNCSGAKGGGAADSGWGAASPGEGGDSVPIPSFPARDMICPMASGSASRELSASSKSAMGNPLLSNGPGGLLV